MTAKQMRTILEICAALAAERDREALLSRILDAAMDLTRCDGGTLYLLEPDGLHFCRMVTRSLRVRQGGPRRAHHAAARPAERVPRVRPGGAGKPAHQRAGRV